MRTRITTAAAALLLAALTACGPTTDTSTDSGKASGKEAASDSDAKNAALPNFVGKGLQSAQDDAQTAGFYALDSHDALGRGREQALDRNWKVCSQKPAPGDHSTNTTVDFGTVKIEEDCPAGGDQDEPEAAGDTMPDLKGKSVKIARQTLDSSTSLTATDGSGQDRMVLLESNWQVCTIDPAAGAKLDGQPVTITAVKFGEDC